MFNIRCSADSFPVATCMSLSDMLVQVGLSVASNLPVAGGSMVPKLCL